MSLSLRRQESKRHSNDVLTYLSHGQRPFSRFQLGHNIPCLHLVGFNCRGTRAHACRMLHCPLTKHATNDNPHNLAFLLERSSCWESKNCHRDPQKTPGVLLSIQPQTAGVEAPALFFYSQLTLGSSLHLCIFIHLQNRVECSVQTLASSYVPHTSSSPSVSPHKFLPFVVAAACWIGLPAPESAPG